MRSVAAILTLVACVHAGLWALLQRQVTVPEFRGQLASISYSPYTRGQNPDRGDRPTADQIRADLKRISPYTRAIRTYSSTGGQELIPAIAAEFGLKVTLGIWLDIPHDGMSEARKQEVIARNEREIRAGLELARRYSNITAIAVGNETTLRVQKSERMTAAESTAELIKLIQMVKRQSPVPVTTGEIWTVWLDHPELASAVDFIGAHILPYWEGVPERQAAEDTLVIYNKLRQAHPGKRIVIAEFGWPSAGYNYKGATPGRIEQAMVLRDFVARADAYGVEYNIVEVVDQPWKTSIEGGVGPYWGIFDASRDAKFAWTGAVRDADHWKIAGVAVLIGVLFSLPILTVFGASMAQAVMLAAAANIIGAWLATVFAFWQGHYFVPGAAFALGLGTLLLIPLIIIALARVQEIAAIAFGRLPRRLLRGPAATAATPEAYAPKVSIHIPAHREPPEMLRATLDAVARLEYPNFECVVVINNTPEPELWCPVEAHCRELGERFKFVRAENLSGYKAGALRLALANTAADAEIIGVIDADYVVRPEWLKDLVPVFADPKVALIQAPQDHRDDDRSVMHHAMNGEYAGFFDIGMVQRNEANAIIVHGTMCLIRRAAIEAAGGWSSDTIVEDTDLGLCMLELGWQTLYTNRRYGHGLLPDTFEAYKKQRHRWAYGGFQIIRKHWRHLMPWVGRLAREQKREFALGWLNWLGAESIGVLVALLNVAWVPVIVFADIAIPDKILTIPIVAAFAVSLLHFIAVYRLRVAVSLGQMIGAVFAAMSLQWTVARAVGIGLCKSSLPFKRTAKGGATRKGPDFPAFWEGVLGALLLISALLLFVTNYKQIHEINIFAFVLVLQSLPFVSAVGIAILDGSRVNDFGFWRGMESRLRAILRPRPAVAEASAKLPATENRIETVP